MGTENVVYIYSVIKKNNMPFAATWMDPEVITLSKSDKEKEKYHKICGI